MPEAGPPPGTLLSTDLEALDREATEAALLIVPLRASAASRWRWWGDLYLRNLEFVSYIPKYA